MDFAEYVAAERLRISEKRREFQAQIEAIENKIKELDADLLAVQAYETAKRGKRSAGAQRRENILHAIRSTPGIKRAGICDRLGIRGDSNQAQAVSVALSNLVKEGVIRREGSRSYYAN